MLFIRQWLLRQPHRVTNVTAVAAVATSPPYVWQLQMRRCISTSPQQQLKPTKYPARPKVEEDEFEEVFLKGR